MGVIAALLGATTVGSFLGGIWTSGASDAEKLVLTGFVTAGLLFLIVVLEEEL